MLNGGEVLKGGNRLGKVSGQRERDWPLLSQMAPEKEVPQPSSRPALHRSPQLEDGFQTLCPGLLGSGAWKEKIRR